MTAVSRLGAMLPDAITTPVGTALYAWRLQTATEHTHRCDGREWTVRRADPNGFDCYEPTVTRTLLDWVGSDTVVYDVGAHVGYFPATLLAVGDAQASNIHAFEPDPTSATLLAENCRRYDCHPVRLAVAAVGGPDDDYLTIDEYAATAADPDVIKIDGGPASGPNVCADDILPGAASVLDRARPRVIVEVHLFADDYGDYRQRIWDALDGYDIAVARTQAADWVAVDDVGALPTSATGDRDHYFLRAVPAGVSS